MDRKLLLLFFASSLCAFAQSAKTIDGYRLFIEHCAVCHRANSGTRAPQPEALQQLPSETVLHALESGVMKAQGATLSADQRRAVAAFVSRHAPPVPEISTGFCPSTSSAPNAAAPIWNGWGAGITNARFQSSEAAQLSLGDVSKLKLKWAFGFPGGSTAAQPAVAGDRVLVGASKGVYSLDAKSGCIHLIFKSTVGIRAAVSVSPDGKTAYFADRSADAFAVETATGKQLWKTHLDPNSLAQVTGAPLLVDNRLYIPISSGEEGAAINPYYECCQFRGSVVSLDASSGKQLWKTYAIPEIPKPTGKNAKGTPTWGPSGAPIWAPVSADVKRRVLYVAAGNNYSDPPDTHSDAILALAMDTGRMLWSQQLTPKDRWNLACLIQIDLANCPPTPGDDYDFGAAPVLVDLPRGRSLVLAAQKSGVISALDPDQKGKIVWQNQIAKGGALGGVEWGGAVADGRAYYPISDWAKSPPTAGGGLVALHIDSGKQIWRAPAIAPDCIAKPGCSAAQIAPATVIPGVVFSGSMDGHLRAYRAEDGKVFWDFNTAQDFKTVDGIEAHGGSLNANGPAIVAGMLYLTSGQPQGMPGNVLLAFSVDGQ